MGMGFFDNATPGWKTPLDQAWDPAPQPTVPAPIPNAPTMDNNVHVMPPAAPAAPTRNDAVSSALNTTWNGKTPMTTADANIAAQVPYQDPNRPVGQPMLGVGGVTQSQSTGGTYLSPEAKRAAKAAEAEQVKVGEAKLQEGKVADQVANELAAQREQQARQLEEKAQQDLARQTAIQKRVDDTMQQQQKDSDAYQKAVASVDPNRMMKGGRGVLAAIASGLGAFGAALTHSENGAQHIIDNAISRDWQAQKDAVEGKKFQLDMSGKLVQQLRQTLSDEQSVQLAHNAALREAMATKFDAMAIKNKGTEAAVQFQTLAQQQRAIGAQNYAEMMAREQIHATNTVSTQLAPMSKATAYENQLAHEAEVEKQKHSIAENRGEIPSGEDRTRQNKAVESLNADVGILRNLDNYRKQLRESTMGGVNVGASQRGAQMQQDLLLALEDYGRQQSGGAITKEEIDNFRKEVAGGSLTITSDAVGKLVRRFQNHIANKDRTSIDSLHPGLRDQTWEMVKSGIGDEGLYNQVKAGKFNDPEERAARLGIALRNKFNERAKGPAGN